MLKTIAEKETIKRINKVFFLITLSFEVS